MMKQWKYSLALLGAAASLAARSSGGSEQEKLLPDVRPARQDLSAMAAPSTLLAGERPCSIEKATPVPDGIRLVFGKGILWHYHVPGDTGVAGLAGGSEGLVIRGAIGPDGRDFLLPPEPHLDLKYGPALSLSEHHASCRVWAIRDQGRSYLRAESSFCAPGLGLPCSRNESTYEIGG